MGVVITVSDKQFTPVIRDDQIAIIEEKHDRDIKDSMEWTVDSDRHTLRIVFKPGVGDFGSGNTVTVRLFPRAFESVSEGVNYYEWRIPTDPL
jgi:hypothetical protein